MDRTSGLGLPARTLPSWSSRWSSPALCLREDRLRDSGEEVFRFTWEEAVHRPVVLEQRARRAFARGLARRAV